MILRLERLLLLGHRMRFRSWSLLTLGSVLVIHFGLALADLAWEVFILLFMIKHLMIVTIGQDFRSISKKNDPAGTAANTMTAMIKIEVIVIPTVLKVTPNTRTTKISCWAGVSIDQHLGSREAVPYSGGAQGPSPRATLSAITLYHSSLLLPFKRATTIIVILSHPTPPVSLFDAKQLSIMFSQILESSWFAATPRRTNSTTACDDWQSQIPGNALIKGYSQKAVCIIYIPSHAMTRNSSSSVIV